jgi:predicted transcriptional regulator
MRQYGHRDKKFLYSEILSLLKKHPEGMTAYSIALNLEANYCTIRRTYIPDLVKQRKIVTHSTGKTKLLCLLIEGNKIE